MTLSRISRSTSWAWALGLLPTSCVLSPIPRVAVCRKCASESPWRAVCDSVLRHVHSHCACASSASHLFSNIYVVFFSLILFSLAVSWGTTIHRVKMLLAAFGVSFKSEKTKAKQE